MIPLVKNYQIPRVEFKRQLEVDMLDGSEQDLARIGVELGYTVAQQKFGLKDLVIAESARGLELYPRDRAALLKTSVLDMRKTPLEKRTQRLLDAVNQMAMALIEGLTPNSAPEVGYGFISYFGEDKAVKMEILEIRNSSAAPSDRNPAVR
jgi:hypothetical protein